MNIWDIDKMVGCWVGPIEDEHEFNMAVVSKAQSYGYKPLDPQTIMDYRVEVDDAYDYLNSICPHGYWFDFDIASDKYELWLVSEDA